MTDQNKINYFGEGPNEALNPNPAGEEPENNQSPSTNGENDPKVTNPRYERWKLFTGI